MSRAQLFGIEKASPYFFRWLGLAVFALACAGLFSIILALLRVPAIHALIPYDAFFKTSLVVHVNFSVLIWFFTIQAAFIINLIDKHFPGICNSLFYIKLFAMLLLFVSPFIKNSTPYLNNYVPMLADNLCFVLALALFFAAYLLTGGLFFIYLCEKKIRFDNCYFAFVFTTTVISFISILAVYLSYKQLMPIKEIWQFDLYFFYENLFWASGHLMQFMFLSLGQLAWIYCCYKIFDKISIIQKFATGAFYLNMLVVLPTPYYFTHYTAASAQYMNFYTDHMKYFGGVSSIILFLGILWQWYLARNIKSHYSLHFLILSLAMFFFGGVAGLKITAINTEVPAHYHGSIVSISIALMAFIYIILEKFVKINKKLFTYQAYIYGIGQFLHILGLFLSGGYGALRKTPGGEFSSQAKIYLSLIGAGGIMAMLGGLMFVILFYTIILKRKNNSYVS